MRLWRWKKMKYKDFKERVEEWGRKYHYEPVIDIVSTYIEIGFKDEYYMNRICLIHKSERFVMDLIWGTCSNLSENAKGHFFEIVTKFAATKPEDRKGEKKYYVKLPWMAKDSQYLNVDTSTGMYFTAKAGEFAIYQTKFTMEEIEKLKEKYNLDSFEIQEVEE